MVASGTKAKTALILGVTGQDGALLSKALLDDGWTVFGGFRRGHSSKLWRLEELGVFDKITLVSINLHEPHQVIEAITQIRPAHVYHFAGESFVADSYQQPRSVIETNTIGTLNVLEAIRICSPETKLFFSSTAEIFSTPANGTLLDENSALGPTNPYAISKLAAQQLVSLYRTRHGLHVLSGIMFNHESPYRSRNFVTRKITYHLARLRMEGGPPMQLGDFSAGRDWGAAAEYMGALPAALNVATPQDYVFATGTKTTVQEFLRVAAEAAGFKPAFEGSGADTVCRDAKTHTTIATTSAKYLRPFDTPPLIGSPKRLEQATGFKRKQGIGEMAEEMVKADLQRRKIGLTHV